MRITIITIIFACISIYSFSQYTGDKEIEKALQAAKAPENNECQLFYGFKFGMTESEYNLELESLTQAGKAICKEGKYLVGRYGHSEECHFQTLFPKFENDKLIELTVFFTHETFTLKELIYDLKFESTNSTIYLHKDNDNEIFFCFKKNILVTCGFMDNKYLVFRYENLKQ